MPEADALLASWSNFFILVGTGSATLAGLVFVALTINLRGVARDATHKFRAINMLAGGITAGIYVAAVSTVLTFVYLVSGSWLLFMGTLQTTDETPAS